MRLCNGGLHDKGLNITKSVMGRERVTKAKELYISQFIVSISLALS